MQIHQFNGADLFSIRTRAPIPGSLPQANLEFTNKRLVLPGAGIYAILWDGHLLYLGSFRGTALALHQGNVVRARWSAHLGSLTGRGRRISLSARGIARISEEFDASRGNGFAAISDVVRAADPAVLTRDKGCLTTVARLRFAAAHYDEFISLDDGCEDALSHFDFVYAQWEASDTNGHDLFSVRALVRAAEHELIERFAPPANTSLTTRTTELSTAAVIVPAIEEALRRRLGDQCAVAA